MILINALFCKIKSNELTSKLGEWYSDYAKYTWHEEDDMNREEILNASRKENRDQDLVEIELASKAGRYAIRVGATACCVLSLLSLWIADTFLYSPWVIYFSLLATNWFVRHTQLKTRSDLVLSITFLSMTLVAFVGFVARLFEVAA